MIKIIIVPGLDGSPAPHWQQWWAATDARAALVDLSDPQRPEPSRWEAELADAILLHPGAILVGHSLGAILITRVLTAWPQLQINGAMLVAPAEPQGKSRIGSFAPLREVPLRVPAVVVASRNDPWMGFSRAHALAKAWQADLIDAGFSGHINVASGFGPWPQGKAICAELASHISLAGPCAPAHSQFQPSSQA